MNTIAVLLINDSQVINEGVINTLKELPFQFEFGEATTHHEIFLFVHEHPGCFVFLNVQMKKLNGYFIGSNLLKSNKEIRMILVSSMFSNPLLAKLINEGARAVLTHDSTKKEFQDAFRSVLAGDHYLFGTESMVTEQPLNFSPLEFKLIHLMSEGKTSKEISCELHHTSKTIETYRSRLLRKTGMKNTSQLLSFFYKHELR